MIDFFKNEDSIFCVKERGLMKQILFNVSRGIAILFVVGLAMMILAGRWGLLVLKSFAADSKRMNTLADETWDYMYGGAEPTTRVSVEGCVAELDPEIKEYMNEYLMEVWEYTEDELAEANILMIQQPKSLVSLISIFWLGLACVLIAVLWFVIKMIRYSKNEKAV